MKLSFIFLIIILAFTSFAYLSIDQISNLHYLLSKKPDTVLLKPQIEKDLSCYVYFSTLDKSKAYNYEYVMDSLFIKPRDTIRNFLNDVDKVVYNISVFNRENDEERFQTYIGTRNTNFAAKVLYPITTSGSSHAYDNYVVTALIYLKNGDIKIPFPTNR